MAQRSSLLEGTGMESGTRKGGGGGRAKPAKDRAEQIKLGAALALFVCAGLLMGWYFGAFDFLTAGTQREAAMPTAEAQAELQKQDEQRQKMKLQPDKFIEGGE